MTRVIFHKLLGLSHESYPTLKSKRKESNLITIDGYLQRNPAPASNGVDDLLNRLRAAFVVYGDTKRDHIEAATSQNEAECTDDLEDIFDVLDELFALIWSGITCDKEKRAYSRFFKQYENSQNS